MIAGLSPFAQRLVALGLLALALLAAFAAVETSISTTTGAVEALDKARTRSARLDAMLRRPSPPDAPPVPADFYFRAASHEAAAALAAARIAAAAAAAGLPAPALRTGPQVAALPNLIRVAVAAEAPEPALLAFVSDLERGAPPVRLRAWRIVRLDGEAPRLRLEATAVAAWGGGA
jgi:hypothetical protein